MNFNFSIYPFRNRFPEVEKDELERKDAYPVNSENEDLIVLDEEHREYIVDFGKETVGYLKFFAQGEGVLHIVYGEWRKELFDTGDSSVDWYERPEDETKITAVSRTEVFIDRRRAFRYVLIKLIKGKITLGGIRTETVTCTKRYNSEFKCSDKLINDIYGICMNTTSNCMQKYFEDGVKRDGLLWSGDARIEAKCNYALFGSTEIVKRSIKYFLRSMRSDGFMPTDAIIGGAIIHPVDINYMFDYVGGRDAEGVPRYYNTCGEMNYLNYTCDFIAIVYDYLMYTGDNEFVSDIFSYLKLCVKHLCEIDKTDVTGKLIPQVHRNRRKNIDNMCDVSSYVMELVDTLYLYRKLCVTAGDKVELQTVEGYIHEYKNIAGRYLDENRLVQRKCGKDEMYLHVPQGQTFALLSGLCDKEQYSKIIGEFYTDKCAYPECGKSKYWWLKGVFESGNTETALKLIRKEWGVLVDKGETTCMERWDVENMDDVEHDYVLSNCHGWSAGPAVFLKEYVLGVKAVENGFKKVIIAPSLGDLEYAEGTVPTPYGLIYVRADRSGVKYEVPQGIEVIEGE